VKPSRREVLINSNVPAIAVAVLLFWSLNWGFQALCSAFLRATDFLVTAVAILGIPYSSPGAYRYVVITTLSFLFYAFVALAGAWLLSRSVYGTGPLRSLSKCRTTLARRHRD
jgi:hypothetical protein